MLRTTILCLIASFLFVGCGDDDQECTIETSNVDITTYLNTNNLTAQSTASGLHYIIDTPGGAEKPTSTSSVTVTYKGYLTNGETFDSNDSFSFNLQNVIAGWREGIPLFGKGGSGRLFIPCQLGYGNFKQGSIPAGSVLIFDISLEDFTP